MARILVVDDDESQLFLCKEELAEDGHTVLLAQSGREGVEKARRDAPNLVVLDIHMPDMDGIEAMPRMLAHNHKLPVILHTAYGMYRDSFLTWSADAYLLKSLDLTDLKAKIRELLNTGDRTNGR